METTTTTQSIDLFMTALRGQNYSPKTLRAYGDDLRQFIEWVEENRVDWDHPRRFTRVDIEGFMSYLAGQNMTGVTRVRKLAAIRKLFTFMEDHGVIPGNPANTVKGARREEKEPGILYREQYKALLYEASENVRDYAIIMTFLQTGIRLSELANLRLDDVDFDNKVLIVRHGKGKKDRHIPLVDEYDEWLEPRSWPHHKPSMPSACCWAPFCSMATKCSWPSTCYRPPPDRGFTTRPTA